MKNAFSILSMILMSVCCLLKAQSALALPANHYTQNSVLAQGKWARVQINETGMHLITIAQLQSLGFNDASKVHVFGMGGRLISHGLNEATPDDLPLQPSVLTDKGIVFFAVDQFSWQESLKEGRPYSHSIHPYSDSNYYYISDVDIEANQQLSTVTLASVTGEPMTNFTARTVHEKELEPSGTSGSQIYGEDFRSSRSQTFSFNMPDRVNGTDANVFVRFAARTSNGTSSIVLKANGTALPSTAQDHIGATSSFAAIAETAKKISAGGETLSLGIDYSQTGVLYKARLDYIELFYVRKLTLRNGELHFYGVFQAGDALSVSGCNAQTIIWDVTDCTSPKLVKYTLSGDKAAFTIAEDGHREFVAFNAASIARTVTADAKIANQDIHGLETPDMVIITWPEYAEGARRIAALHERHDGFRVNVLNASEIFNEFSGGKQDPGAFRRLLKMWYDRGQSEDGHSIRYCLLMGKPSYDQKMLTTSLKNAGFVPMPIYQSYDGLT
ncbi:MAG: hypothetical protein J1D85_08550, partial [Bacteroidales bacterium]|nr:hypothetical protein [Bacteroidales bacterium]